MSFWKRISKKPTIINEHEILSSLLSRKYCTNCGLGLPSKGTMVCPQCGHDQREPIAKKITNPRDMACAAISYCAMSIEDNSLREYIDDLVSGYGKHLNQPKKNQILNIFLLSDLALTCIVYFAYYEDNPKQKEIVEAFKEALDDYLLHAYGKEDYKEARNCIASMLEEYDEAFREEDPIKCLSKVLQYRTESVILDVPLPGRKFALPSIHAFAKYLIHVTSFLPPFQATLNKWKIE